jgi:hypothetical protein
MEVINPIKTNYCQKTVGIKKLATTVIQHTTIKIIVIIF